MSLTAEQLEFRRTGIGGSEVAAALGVSRYSSPLELYLRKRGEAPPVVENEPMKWGSRLEALVRQEYAERTGRTVHQAPTTMRHPEFPFLVGTPDGLILEERGVYEGKTSRYGDDFGDAGTDEVPPEHNLQCQHYMLMTGFDWADLAVLIGGSEFRVYTIRADRGIQETIVRVCGELWDRIERGDAPAPTTDAGAALLYGHLSVPTPAYASEATYNGYLALVDLEHRAAALEAEREERRAQLKAAMGAADTLVYGRSTLATWKMSKGRTSIDGDALKVQFPAVYDQVLRTGEGSRRFLLKGAR